MRWRSCSEIENEAARFQSVATRLNNALHGSIEATRAAKQLDYIPGSVEWADFDPTATANALALFDVPQGLDRTALHWTFEKYLIDWRRKHTAANCSGELHAV